MADDSSANSEYGPGKFRAIFEQGLDFAVDRILRRAESQGGSLSASDVREELQRFKADPSEDTTAFFNDAWRECTFAVESHTFLGFSYGRIPFLPRSSEFTG